jgi:D-glycero-alpha-D-manno-heptose-7-phosphate kinase
MIISRTPFRVSLFGGGSDYPQWYGRHGGRVLGFAINKYCYITLRPLPPFFAHRHRIVYSVVETVNDIEDIQHPAVRHVLRDLGVSYGVEIHHDGDLPARSGLGSSSSFTVGLIHALNAGAGRISSKEGLARTAIRIEQEVINEAVGSQDQVWAAHGGMNRIDFQPNGVIDVRPLIMGPERRAAFIGRFMLFFTGLSRFAPETAARQIANLDARAGEIRALMDMVDEAQAILGNPTAPLSGIGRLLGEAWRIKRGLADGVSNSRVDAIYEAGRAAGALGGKLLGAGGGGFILFHVEPEHQPAVRAALAGLVEVALDVDDTGSTIVVYQPDGQHGHARRGEPARERTRERQPAA